MGILNICNLWILLRKIVIYLVGRKCHLHGICKEVFIYRDSRYDITYVNFNSEKVHEDDIFVRRDILQFFSGESKGYKSPLLDGSLKY